MTNVSLILFRMQALRCTHYLHQYQEHEFYSYMLGFQDKNMNYLFAMNVLFNQIIFDNLAIDVKHVNFKLSSFLQFIHEVSCELSVTLNGRMLSCSGNMNKVSLQCEFFCDQSGWKNEQMYENTESMQTFFCQCEFLCDW